MKSCWFAIAVVLAAPAASATDVNVIGLFSGRAVVVINRGQPRTLRAGESTPEGVKLISADSRAAVIEIDGKRQTLEMGQHFESSVSASSGSGRDSVVLSPDTRGHFIVDAQVNGGYIRFLVDTGATLVSISTADASRLGIDYLKGERSYSILADGRRVPGYRLTLDSVSVGGLTIYGVEAMVSSGGAPLLGMSFLNRTEMVRAGQNLTLTKRY